MTLGELIAELKKRDPSKRVLHGFSSGHSDRGDYSNVAFSPVESTTFGEMLAWAEMILDTVQEGYKGGSYTMHQHVDAHIGEYGACGEEITRHHFLYWDSVGVAP